MRLYRKTKQRDDKIGWSVYLKGHLQRWDDDIQEWLPVRDADVPPAVADKALDMLADACRCRKVLWRIWPDKYTCNMVASSQSHTDFRLSLQFDTDAATAESDDEGILIEQSTISLDTSDDSQASYETANK